MFAVWEPILPTDWSAPGSGVLHRLDDGRVRQFWDPNHLMAGILRQEQLDQKLDPECCTQKGILWDLLAAYPPNAPWGELPKDAVLFNGPIVHVTAELEAGLKAH